MQIIKLLRSYLYNYEKTAVKRKCSMTDLQSCLDIVSVVLCVPRPWSSIFWLRMFPHKLISRGRILISNPDQDLSFIWSSVFMKSLSRTSTGRSRNGKTERAKGLEEHKDGSPECYHLGASDRLLIDQAGQQHPRLGSNSFLCVFYFILLWSCKDCQEPLPSIPLGTIGSEAYKEKEIHILLQIVMPTFLILLNIFRRRWILWIQSPNHHLSHLFFIAFKHKLNCGFPIGFPVSIFTAIYYVFKGDQIHHSRQAQLALSPWQVRTLSDML